MDTDNFSDMAYDIIVQAARISDTLKAEGVTPGKLKKGVTALCRRVDEVQETPLHQRGQREQ